MNRQVGGFLGVLVVWLLAGVASTGYAAIDVYEFEDQTLRARYLTFIEEMRCPKCQNQNLAGSDSPIAADLRRELHRLLQEGKTDEEIVDFMVARYGDFILYKPRVQSNTLLLWFTPIVLLILGVLVAFMIQRGNRRQQAASVGEAERAKLAELLDSNKQDKQL